jgi:hypothetical protein
MTAQRDALLTKLGTTIPVPASPANADLDEVRRRLSVHEGDLIQAYEPQRTQQRHTPDAVRSVPDPAPIASGRRETPIPLRASPPRPAILTAGALLAEEFPVPTPAVDGLLYEGLTLLAAREKTGKSWLMLAIALGVAGGSPVLGGVPSDGGDVLYLGLEDGARRLQSRLRLLLADEPAPERLHLATTWPRLDDGGVEELARWLADHPHARLVLVHHLRKMAGDDPLDLINASTGLAAAVDALLILRRARGEADASLYVTGRDVAEEREVALRWETETVSWVLLGDAAEARRSGERQAILDLLRTAPTPLGRRRLPKPSIGTTARRRYCCGRWPRPVRCRATAGSTPPLPIPPYTA